MQKQLADMQSQIQNQQKVEQTATALYEKGLIKQHQDGSWEAVDSYDE